jgi:protein TonB
MSIVVSQTAPGGRVGEVALWGAAGLLMLSVHVGGAAYLMRQSPEELSDNAPPAAIMIELAPEPEAVNTEDEQIAPDMQEQEEVLSEQTEPVEEPVEPVEQAEPMPPEPVEPPPPEVAELPPEPTPPEPVVEEPPPEPEPEMTQTIPEPPPEPVEEVDPIEEHQTAVLENVEVPLPAVRPPLLAEKPPEEKKPEPKKPPTRKVEKPKQQQQQARQQQAEAKAQVQQSDRTAASQTSTGLFSSRVSPQQWMTRVRTKIARYARRCPGNDTGIVTVRFSFDGSGNIGSVAVARSSGNPAIDDYVTSAVRKASPIPAPPSGAGSSLSQPVKCE